jgi:transcriptional regulator with GAF, ATPase, and Fis domain/tetratricopeptide (TPR) repeat protein
LLGEGRRKRVYLARDCRIERDVALAFIKADGLDATGRARVWREVQALGRLGDHPHIVNVFDAGEEAGQAWLVTEYMAGGTLAERLRAAPGQRLAAADAARLMGEIVAGLAHAHAHGVVHRDLKPDNVWLAAAGSAKLGDFGIATGPERLTSEGLVVGTAAHLAPELASGAAADPRADLYALGVVLYELVTGRLPFVGDDAVAVVYQHAHTVPVAPSWHVPDLPRALEGVILGLLAKAPEERPSLRAVGETLAAVAAGRARRAEPEYPRVPNPLDALAGDIFVGREREIGVLRAAADAARGGRGQFVLVAGEPGAGKTRLLAELATYAGLRGATVTWGRAAEAERAGAPAFWPWVQVLRACVARRGLDALRATLGAAAADLAVLLPELPDRWPDRPAATDATAEQARFQLFDTVATCLRTVAADRPLVVLLDDLHGADEPSLRLLEFATQQLQEAAILFVGAYRDVEVTQGLARLVGESARIGRSAQYTLGGLTAPEVERLLTLTAGAAPPSTLVAALHEGTDGNPFFVTEVVRLLVVQGRLDAAAPPEPVRLPLPSTVRAAVAQRAAQLSPETQQVLGVVAVMGRDADLALLRCVSPVEGEALLAAVEEGVAARLLAFEGRDRVRFAHVLIADALYENLETERRRALHHRIGEVLGTVPDPPLAKLAHHLAHAGPEHAEQAIRSARRAGDDAMRLFAFEEAARLYALALDALAPAASAHRAELLLALAAAQALAGDVLLARTTHEQAFAAGRASGRPDLMARAATAMSPLKRPGVEDRIAVDICEEALSALCDRDRSLRARVQAKLASHLWFADIERARQLISEAVSVLRESDPCPVRALTDEHFLLWGPDVPIEERLARATELIRGGEAHGRADAVFEGSAWRVVDLLELGDIDRAEHELPGLVRQADALRRTDYRMAPLLLQWHLRLLRGPFDDLEMPRATVSSADGSFGYAVLGLLIGSRVAQGRFEDAERTLGQLRDMLPGALVVRCIHAYLCVETGRDAEAQQELEAIMARGVGTIPRDIEWAASVALLALVAGALGDRPRARELYEALAPHAARNVFVPAGPIHVLGWGTRYLGLLATTLGRLRDAAHHFEDALTMNTRMGARPWVALTQHDFAAMLLGRGGADDHTRARHLLREALATAEALGMRAAAARARALLAQAAPGVPADLRRALTASVATPRPLGELTAFVTERCRELLAVEAVAVLLLDETRPGLYNPVPADDSPRSRLPADSGIAGAVLRAGQPILVRDVTADARVDPAVDVPAGLVARSLLSVPLTAGGESVGVLTVVNRGDGSPLGDDELALLAALAPEIAAALRAARRYRILKTSEEQLRLDILAQRRVAPRRDQYPELVGESPALLEVLALMESAAAAPLAVLLEGETGTGKELVARGIHRTSPRAAGPFLPVNCAALPEHLLESELFGHRRGAFSGATQDRAGRFEAAAGGTVLLDEIGELPAEMQPKLLRVLQDGEVTRLGENRPRTVDVRVIAATNRDLAAEVAARRFREDVYYRLAAFPIALPPLRARRTDIPLLAEWFLAVAAARQGKQLAGLDPGALALLRRYDWPGNVRELEHAIARAVALARDGEMLAPGHFAGALRGAGRSPAPPTTESPPPAVAPALRRARDAFEARYIAEVLEQAGGNVARAAAALGLSRAMLHRKLRKLGLR